MYKQIATITVAAALALAGGGAQAQLGNGGAKYDGIEQGEIGAAGYVNQYVGIAQQALAAQSGLLSMLGLNPEAATVAAAGRDLQPTATRAALEEALKQQADAANLLTRRFASAQPVAEDSRIRFGQDVAALAQAVSDSAAIAKSMAGNRKKLGAANGAGAIQAVYLSKALSDHVKQLQQSLKAAAGYAAANGIVLPPEVAAAAG